MLRRGTATRTAGDHVDTTGDGRSLAWLAAACWAATRAVLLLFVFKVFIFPGPDVTRDVSVIYQGWYEVLRTGTFPLDDVTWQYPPAAALPVLSPGAAAVPGLHGRRSSSWPAPPTWRCLLLLRYAGRRRAVAARGLAVGGGRPAARARRCTPATT